VRLVPSILRCLGSDLLVGIMDGGLVHLVLDHNPSNSEFGLQFKDFGWNPSFLVELSCNLISDILVPLRAQILGCILS
jgi:hypothetical protein